MHFSSFVFMTHQLLVFLSESDFLVQMFVVLLIFQSLGISVILGCW